MTPELARFIVNTRAAFAGFTDQQLYQLAVSLAAELHDRHADVEPEAHALCAALLAHANGEQRKIFSEDCSDACWCAWCQTSHRPGESFQHPAAAEKS